DEFGDVVGGATTNWAQVRETLSDAFGLGYTSLDKNLAAMERFGLIARNPAPGWGEPYVRVTATGEDLYTGPDDTPLLAAQLLGMLLDTGGRTIRPAVAALRAVEDLDGWIHLAEYTLCASEPS